MGEIKVYPFHAPFPGLPELFHVSCDEHPDFGFCGEKSDAEDIAAGHRIDHYGGHDA